LPIMGAEKRETRLPTGEKRISIKVDEV